MIDNSLMRQARKGMYKVNLVKQSDDKFILEVLDKKGYYIGSCIVGYVDDVLEANGIMKKILRKYKKLVKEK